MKKVKIELKGYTKYMNRRMLHLREAWCLSDDEMAIFRRPERAVRAMCGVKLIEKRSSQDL